MSDKKQGVETGEFGFCPDCGQVVAVVVTPADRLPQRLMKAFLIKEGMEGRSSGGPYEILRDGVFGLLTASSVAKALVRFGLIDGDPARATRAAATSLHDQLLGAMIHLVVAGQALSSWLGKPVDLLREATELLERETDVLKGVGKDEQRAQ